MGGGAGPLLRMSLSKKKSRKKYTYIYLFEVIWGIICLLFAYYLFVVHSGILCV